MEQKDIRAEELWQFHEGTEACGYRFWGAHQAELDGRAGWMFRVWAPHARSVAVAGDFNGWSETANPMLPCEGQVWEAFVPGLAEFDDYKFVVTTRRGEVLWKADPCAFHAATRPGTNSKLYELAGYDWGDESWLRSRRRRNWQERPLNIYEVHLGSWRRGADGEFLDYRTLGEELAAYAADMGYDYVELLPVTEHPLDASWGYQCTGYFAPTSRWGTPKDFMYFVDVLHRKGIGVILDWVPAHFCKDAYGLMEFDGGCCYEYSDPNKQEHDGWGTRVFDFGKPEVRSFLISSAVYWIREYHVDGLRVDAVASMLYLDYGRTDGHWTPNRHGGRENLEAIRFLRQLNRTVLGLDKGLLMVAEESTAWPHVTGEEKDSLGFSLKWNMGWMNDMCHYLKMDPYFRQYHHKDVTFSLVYAFSERFLLPMSHDEVVHMKGSLRGKMPGDDAMQLAGVRGFYAYMLAHPGKKLTFMGTELGQWHEWDFEGQLDWYLLDNPDYRKEQIFFRDIHALYRATPALWQRDFDWSGFEWLVADDNHNNVVVFLRRDKRGGELIAAVNFSPVAHEHYRFGVPQKKQWREIFNTDAAAYGGGDFRNPDVIRTEPVPSHGRPCSIDLRIPPLGAVFLKGGGTWEPPAENQTGRKDSK